MGLTLTRSVHSATLSPLILGQFCNSMSYLLDGGVSVRASLDLIKKTKGPVALAHLILQLEQAINAGQQLSVAMRARNRAFDDVAVALVESAERDGSLGLAFSTIGDLIDRETEYKKRLHAAFAYPAILLVAVLLMLFFLIAVLTPAVKPLLLASGSEPGFVTRLLFWLSGEPFLGCVILGLTPALLIAFYSAAHLNSAIRRHWDQFQLRFWVLGVARRDLQYSRFCNVCARLIRSGLDIDETLIIATGTINNLAIVHELKAVNECVRAGDSLSKALEGALSAPLMLAPLIQAAEASGNTAAALERTATQLEQQARWHLDRFTRIAPPMLISFLGLLVLAMVVGLLGPIFGAAVTMGASI